MWVAHIGCDKAGKQICSDKEAEQLWLDILDNIHWTFVTAKEAINFTTLIPLDKEQRKRDVEFANEHLEDNWKILTTEEVDRFYKGFDLFKTHFFSLWD